MATGSRQKAHHAKSGSRSAVGAPKKTAAPPAAARPAVTGKQDDIFERAIALFHHGDYAKAKPLFEAATEGPQREMAHAARLHAEMCARRMASAPAPRTAEEHYDYGVAMINARRLDVAERHLAEAAALMPRGDHIHYALALCRGLAGDLRGAARHLRRAIELQPRNRLHARNDPDFAEIARLSPLAELLEGRPGER